VYSWGSWETQAFAPELSTVTVVLYAQTVFDVFPKLKILVNSDLGASTNTIHGLFRLSELLLAAVVIPVIVVVLVVNLVRAYRPEPENPSLWLVWRANLYAIVACFATNPLAPYINHWAAQYL
jgi:carbon starvation protein CstA